MKMTPGFDARRLRSHKPQVWRWRLCASLTALLCCLGVLLLLAGIAGLLGLSPQLAAPLAALACTLLGPGLLWLGLAGWRSCRRRRRASGLGMAPHLLKRR